MAPRPRKSDVLSPFASRISALLHDRRYVDFDDLCGLPRGTTQNIISGVKPSVSKAEAIIRATNCNARWLITGEGEPFPNDAAANKKSPPHHAGGLGNTSDLQSTPDQTDAVVAFAQCSLALAAALQATKAGTLPLPLFLRLMDDVVQAFGSIPQGLLPAVDALPLPSRRKA